VKRGTQILGLLLLVALLLAIASSARWTGLPEPAYDGQKLSQWATLYQDSPRSVPPAIRARAIDAAHQTRDELVPYALKLMQQEPPGWQTALVRKLAMSRFANRIPSGLLVWLDHDPSRLATTYFAMLGSDAAPAVPELVSILKQKQTQTKSGLVAPRAIVALCYIGEPGQARLAEIVADPAYTQRRAAAYIIEGLEKQGVRVKAMVPALVKNLAATDHEVAKATAYALGEMAIQPDIVVPALTNCLHSPDLYVRGAALDALAKFGAAAHPALSAMVAELDDPDPSVRKWATNAVVQVAPEYSAPAINGFPAPLDLDPLQVDLTTRTPMDDDLPNVPPDER
jgi:hypothetical protein